MLMAPKRHICPSVITSRATRVRVGRLKLAGDVTQVYVRKLSQGCVASGDVTGKDPFGRQVC